MKLRAQLIVVSLVTLLLPWAGCEYVAEMERTLRDGEQDMLGKFAGSVAAYIEGQEALLNALKPPIAVEGAQSLYLFSGRERGFDIDGYPDEDLNLDTDVLLVSEGLAAADPRARISLRAVGDRAYIYLDFNRPSSVKRGPGSVIGDRFDHVELVMGNPDARRRLLLAPGAAGSFTADRVQGTRLIAQYGSEAWWHDEADGYRIELAIPRNWLGEFFGLRVYDASTDTAVMTLNSNGEPAPLYMRSELLEASLRHFSSNVNVMLLDAQGWVRASRTNADLRGSIERPPGFWLLETLYRQLMNLRQDQRPYAAPVGGRLLRKEVTTAMTSDAGGDAGWYVLVEDAGDVYEQVQQDVDAAVVTSAVRIRDRAGNPLGVAVLETSSRGSMSRTSATLVNIIGIAVLVTLLTVVLLVGYASWLSMRIRRLSKQVMTVMEPQGRELGEFPAQTAGDEIGALGRNFGRLLERVRGYTDYLQSLGSKLSHELRTPLAVVSSSLDNLEHEALDATARDYVQRARDGSDRLSYMLTALSEASRVEQAIQGAEKQALNLTELLTHMVAGYRATWPQQRIDLEATDAAVMLAGCPELLAQMLDKLMDNARDFCPDNGLIRFALTKQADMAVLSVENDGPLLPENMSEQLFESMVSVRDRVAGEDAPGAGNPPAVHLGLGLTIVRLVAEFHGGKAMAANRHAESGVIISVQLPSSDHND